MKISDIVLSDDIQPRVQVNWITISEYAADMKAGDEFPPVVVFHDGADCWLADGFHRILAARDYAGLSEFRAEVRTGGKRDAWLYALGANKDRGLRLTSADKKKIVEAMLRDDEWAKWADTVIARHCGVSNHTVGNYRKAIIEIFNDSQPQERTVSRNGTTYKQKTKSKRKKPTRRIPIYDDLPPDDAPEVPMEDDSLTEDKPEESQDMADVLEAEAPQSEITVINADAQSLFALVAEPVHLVITSPPYNVGIDYDIHVDDLSTYIPFLTAVWRECYRVMVSGARIAVVVPFGLGRNPYIPFDCQIMQTLTYAGFTLRGRIIWDKNTTGNRTSWGSFRLPSDPGLRDTTECIIVAHKEKSRLEIPDNVRLKDDKGTHTGWMADSDTFMGLSQDHWVIAPESAQRVKHPAPFPVELAERLIRFYAYPGAHIVDPFAGSGTVGVAAQNLGCNATLIEISQAYCELAKARLGH